MLPERKVLGLTALLALGAGGLLFATGDNSVSSAYPVNLTWWVIASLFVITELNVFHIQVRREAQQVSISEVPLLLGLVFSHSLAVVSARVVAAIIVFAIIRRQTSLKAGLNVVLFFTDSVASVLVFELVSRSTSVQDPRTWLACVLAAATAAVVDAVVVGIVIDWYEGRSRLTGLIHEVGRAGTMAALVAAVALVPVCALSVGGGTLPPLIVGGAVLMLGFRSYALLVDRHTSLERMYQFSEVVTGAPALRDVINSVLTETKTLLRSERAELIYVVPGEDASPGHWMMHSDGRLIDRALPEADALAGTVLPAWTSATHNRESIVVPLRLDGQQVGQLRVDERMGEVRGFGQDDVKLLETIANHAAVALQNGRLIAQLRHEAMHDALTGLPNRALFSELAQAAVGRAEASGTLMATMIMDLDGFKTVNDTLGHHVGDQLLVSVAMRLREAAGPTVTVARLGGDEFAILMEQVPGPDEARAVAQDLLTALEPPVTIGEERVSVGASVGVALAPRDGATSTSVLKCADIAMYAAKESSGGIRVYSQALEHTGSVLLPLVSDLRDAVSRGTVTIAVQPIISLTDDVVLGVEALARWHHPEFGNVEPTTFLPLAERNGFVLPLTLLVLDLSLAACGRWFAEGRNLGIAVNLSPRVLAEPDLPAIVAAALERHGVPAHLLTLEITEGSVIADPGRAIRLLQELRAAGVRLAVDDFGTGYSSLTYLSRLPVQQIKIDKSFVQGLALGERDLAIVRSIVDLGKNLGFEVVAEGIEDQATQRQLLALGCTIAQGYHLGRPMPVDAMPGWLEMRAIDAISARAAEAASRHTEDEDAEASQDDEDERPLRLVR